MQSLTALFLGVTTSPARDFVASLAAAKQYDRVVLPCVGRFASLVSIVEHGISVDRIEASDLSLTSTIIGTLADSTKSLDELPIDWTPAADFTRDHKTPYEQAAGLMLALKFLNLPAKNAYHLSIRDDMWERRADHRAALGAKLEKLVGVIGGIRYEVLDVQKALDSLAPNSFCYVNLPGYRSGYTKMFGTGEAAFGWTALASAEFDPSTAKQTLASAAAKGADIAAYVHHGTGQIPAGWHKLFAAELKADRIDYVVSNREPTDWYAHRKTNANKPRVYEIYNEQEITAETKIQLIETDRATCLYYRDLFVHRLGATDACIFYLMLIDGRVATAFGTNDQDLLLKGTGYLSEVFGISITSKRYNRLGKLFMLCLTSDETRRMMQRKRWAYHLHEFKGIQTTSITIHEEGKTDRSVMRIALREKRPDGRFRIVYRADFRPDDWSACVVNWLKRWGEKKR